MELTARNISKLIIDLLDFKVVYDDKDDYIRLVKFSENKHCYPTVAKKYMHIYIDGAGEKISMVFKMDIDDLEGAKNFYFFEKETIEWSYLVHTILGNLDRFENIEKKEFKRDAKIHLLLK